MSSLTLVIPTANEEENIGRLLEALKPYRHLYQDIIVPDSSTDRTPEICATYGVRVIRTRRPGKGVAILHAIEEASTEFVVVMDADGSHRPNELPAIVARLESGFDLVKGSRFMKGGGSQDLTRIRSFFNFIFTTMANWLFDARLTDLCYGYFGVRRSTVKALGLEAQGSALDIELFVRAVRLRFRVCEVPSVELARYAGRPRVHVFTAGLEVLAIIAGERVGLGMRRFIEARLRHDNLLSKPS